MTMSASGGRGPAAPWLAEIRATVALAWPMVLTNLAQIAMTTTDVMMMGRLGPTALAAGTLGYNLYFAPVIFGLGLLLAASPMMASALGRKLHSLRDVRRTVRQALWLAIAVSIPIWLLLWQAEFFLLAMGQEPELARTAASYVRTLQWALLPFFGYVVLRSFISALERPGWALIIMFVMVAFNVLANWCLMFGNLGFPALGVPGSGLATTISSALMFAGLALVVSVERQFKRYQLFGRFWRPDWPRFRELLRLGLPIAGAMTFEVTIFNAAALLMGLISAPALAAHAIAIQIASISFMVPMGLSQAATVRVGRAFGARSVDGIRRAGWTAFCIGVGFMGLMAILMVTLPRTLISGFIDLDLPENQPVIELAISFLALAGLFQIFDGAQAVAAGMLRGLHDTKIAMIYSLLGYWGIGFTLGVVLAFPLNFGGVGMWIGLVTGLAVVSVLLVIRWMRRDRLLPWVSPNALL
ncbi:multidrug efflux protein NorM [Nitratireductor indicus C115]|uniref:Multidrug-efflux transporter n=1 Tax=Nitratireductor indicus C115 TaxID=1231190 RepID=K2P606_9HYPH|nr:MATE family efflux transporter [Nitratireductor indicus]EKF42761.1 multidrug efflux protein NorM [Nitratireductor indicus C115]SFQ39832.1 multidrug resistance protein, MATE family [Nitratireductor indicus]